MSSHAPHGTPPLRAVLVLSGRSAGVSSHVRSLAAGLVARGVRVTVCAPTETELIHRYTAVGAQHISVPARSDPASVAALRTACTGVDVVHAHGVSTGLRAALALGGRRTPLVLSLHAGAHAEGARERLLRVLERRAARAASVVLGASADLVDRARASGARDARLAAVALAGARRGQPVGAVGPDHKARAELGAVDRPLLVTIGALEPYRGYGPLLDAARAWRRLDPAPLLAVAGEGTLRAALQRRIDDEDLPVTLLGTREDARDLLAAADLALLPPCARPCSVLAQEALHARVPLVAPDSGDIAELVGDAAEIVPHGDAGALAAAVTRLLADPARRKVLRDRGEARAASWPTEDETVAQVLSVYDELIHPPAPSGAWG
ncbi:glycosyltransferase family 4 protein [Streptomyces sp. TS71-3]|uniref:glycosyltransferase family 4 protein n=1 Tax=Streptomyces sp. TS71-3 TaxID=2733862 RepID=UPI001B2E3A54|nr:glycosyltransferase family 4 protein [Streptomyces sp. TS71-3]GHJ38577.1 glycosyl transferase [Streptomyces sp. TS71-3]